MCRRHTCMTWTSSVNVLRKFQVCLFCVRSSDKNSLTHDEKRSIHVWFPKPPPTRSAEDGKDCRWADNRRSSRGSWRGGYLTCKHDMEQRHVRVKVAYDMNGQGKMRMRDNPGRTDITNGRCYCGGWWSPSVAQMIFILGRDSAFVRGSVVVLSVGESITERGPFLTRYHLKWNIIIICLVCWLMDAEEMRVINSCL